MYIVPQTNHHVLRRTEILRKHLPYSGPDGIKEVRRIAGRFEEKCFSGAVNQVIQEYCEAV